jgi:hypothetical protein
MRVFRVLPLVCLAIAAGWGAIGLAQPRLISRNPALFEQNANDLERRSLERINLVRSEVGVPPLRWSEQLAESARAYGPKLAELGTFVHSPRAGRPNIGEALWMGPRGEYSIEAMIDYWAEEKRTFKPGIFPDVSTTGNWEDVSHYTQMIWRETREVGCALQRGGRSDYLICHFGPKGNRDGKQVP